MIQLTDGAEDRGVSCEPEERLSPSRLGVDVAFHTHHGGIRMPNSIDRTTIALSYLRKAVAIALLALAAAIGVASTAMAHDDDRGIRMVTQNMYVGTAFDALSVAQTPEQLRAAVATLYNNILASKPAERAAAMAREI